MARTKKTAAKSADPVIVRSLDMPSLEKRVYNMDGAKIRNYDIFSLEKRIYDLEMNGGGGSGDGSKVVIGSFTTENTQYGISSIDCGFKPDLIFVMLPFASNDTVSFWEKNLSYAETKAIWCLSPAESSVYANNLNRETGETGIQSITDDGFTFMCNGSNTRGVTCRYIVIKYPEE